jgi:predicted secreted protein
MADSNKIFKSLQDHTETPPPGLYAKLWKKIKTIVQDNKDLPGTISLPAETTDTLKALTEEQQIWKGLQDYVDIENTPPAFDLAKIQEALSDNKNTTAPTRKRSQRILLYGTAAAAAVTGIIFWVFTNTASPAEEPVKISNSIQNRKADTIITSSATAAAINKQDSKPGKQTNKPASTQQNRNVILPRNTSETNTAIVDNDFFYTLTNFSLPEANSFLESMKKNRKISLNSYSYVNVSDKMAALLKQMYAINRRNKYTWKARRVKARLNRWKKDDAKYFDNGTKKNPLDVLDLSEFLLNNKQ